MQSTVSAETWHILHIDDDEDDHILVRAMLREAKGRIVTVDWAATIDEGRKKLCTDDYHAVLVDYDLGAGTGIDLIRAFASQKVTVPMILLTGRGSYEIDVEAMHAGAALYLTKNEINSLLLERSIRYAIERKQTEQTLRENEAQLRKSSEALHERDRQLSVALDAARLGTWTYNFDDHSFVLDERACQMYRASGPSVSHDSIVQNYLHPDDIPPMLAALHRAADPSGDGRYQIEYRIMQPDGSVCWLNAWGLVDFEGQGAQRRAVRLTGASRDITWEKQANLALEENNAALRASEERFRLASRAVSGVLYDLSIDRAEMYQSEGLESVVGYRPGEEPGGSNKWWPNNIHPDDYPRIQARLQTAIEGESDSFSYEYRIRHKDGHWVDILDQGYIVRDENGQAQRVVGICTDVSDHVRAAKALQEQNERLALLSEAASELLQGEDPLVLLERVYQPLAALLGLDMYLHYQTTGDGEHLDLAASSGYPDAERKKLKRLKMGQAVCGTVALTRQPMIVEHLQSTSDPRADLLRALGITAYACHPLVVKDRLVGTLSFGSRHLNHFDPSAISLISTVCKLIANAIDRKQKEQALRESERNFRELAELLEVERAKLAAAIDNLPVGVGIGDNEGNTLSLNSAGLKLHGFASEAEMFSRLQNYIEEFELSYPDGKLMPAEDWPAARALRGEFVRDYELRLLNKLNGTMSILSYSAAPVKNSTGETVLIVYVIQDMTGRKQAEETLRESERRFRHLADSMPQLVWTAQPDGTVDYYNKRNKEYNGFIVKHDGTWEWSPVLHPDDMQPTVDVWMHALETGDIYQIEHRVQMADGWYRWHLSRGIPAYDEQGKLVKWYGTATDIHDLKQAQADLADYTEKLKQSNEELENFAFVASHDLQEPLRKILLFGNTLRRQTDGQLPEQAEDSLNRMQNAAQRMQAMIDGLLDLSRVNRLGSEFELVDLTSIAQEVLTDLEVRIEATGGQVILDRLPAIEGDSLQLSQLFQNLISNALKFHKEGLAPVVRVTGERIGDDQKPLAKIVVEDNGIGFEQENADRLFQPFVRLNGRSDFEGSGIGLAICRKIVERHGGKITASSQPGQGSKFTIVLPITT
jgi:PAS domain S-box-containing protein